MEAGNSDLETILLSVVCGSLLGLEREYQNKSAGLRTIALICLGATVFTMISQRLGSSDARIAANIVTGIGFLGAGVIFKERFQVKGLTTATVIWIAASIGMVIGIQEFRLAVVLTVIVLIILAGFEKIEYLIDLVNHKRTYILTFSSNDPALFNKLEELVRSNKLKFDILHSTKVDSKLKLTIEVRGNYKKFHLLDQEIMSSNDILALEH